MKMVKLISYITVILLTFSMLACEGPAGPQGERGPQGPEGEQGPIEDDGNANVISDTLTLTDDDYTNGWYTLQTSENSAMAWVAKVAELNVPEITHEIFDSGPVLDTIRCHTLLVQHLPHGLPCPTG